MEQERKDSPRRTSGSKPNVLERVQTGLVTNAPTRPPRAGSPRPTRVARGPVETDPVPTPPSTFPGLQGDGRRTGTSGVDARWLLTLLTLLTLLLAGIAIGALVGAVVAGIAFP